MRTFLEQPEATFYHVTTIENWLEIKNSGFNSKSGNIFVSRVGELPVLIAIAIEQLPEIYTTDEIVFIKLPQSKNNFTIDEIIADHQATVEWTQPFQNIINRNHIPIENIEFMMSLRLEPNRDFIFTYLTRIANSGQVNYTEHNIQQRALTLIY